MSDVLVSEMPVDLSDVWQQVVAGADWATSIYMLDDNEDPEDTTGWAMEVKIAKPNGTILKTLSVGSGIVNTPASGRFDITYAAADTTTLKVQEVKITVKTTDAGTPAGIDYLAVATIPVYYPL